VRRQLLLILFAFVVTACGGASADPVPTTANAGSTAELSGIDFEVHQEPG
jgi:hypothetical protein